MIRRARAALDEWSRTPRRTLRRWDAHSSHFTLPFLAGAIGVAGIARLVEGELLLAAAFLAVAAAGTYLTVLYLKRPVVDPPQPQPVSHDETTRAESERAAWRSRRSI